jgi:hypothetical protein
MSGPLAPDTIRKADDFLDDEKQLKRFHTLGEELFAVFGAERDDRVSSQVRNLQQIAMSARRLADIEDFIKNQMGKNTAASRSWRKVGDTLLEQLDRLRQKSEELGTEEGERLQVRLHLARVWVRAIVGAYLYARAQREMTRHD